MWFENFIFWYLSFNSHSRWYLSFGKRRIWYLRPFFRPKFNGFLRVYSQVLTRDTM
jgi:hypothetical protein